MRYARIEKGSVADLRNFDKAPDPNPKKNLDWRPCPVVAKPDYDKATQAIDGPSYSVGADKVTESWTVRNLTAKEQTDVQQDRDINALVDGVVDMAEILITHIDAHLAKGNIAASDFDAATRAKYAAFKARVDRLKGS